ncbi:MAG: hypothetical protein WBD22_10300 [Pyrinomonadaceae bacterium]
MENETTNGFAIDTTFVLFFLAVELGRTIDNFGFDSVLMVAALGMLLVFPYFLAVKDDRPRFLSWLAGRSLIAVFAVMIGLAFRQSLGVLLPETFRFLPMTLLLVTAMVSCFIQFYGFTRFRFAK